MNTSRTLPALAGLGFSAAVAVEALAFPGGASSADPPAAIAGYYAQHGTTDLTTDTVSLLATPLLLAFLCAAAGRLSGTALRFAQAAATAAAVFELTATAIEMALAASVGRSAPATTTAALFQVTPRLFLISLLCLGLAVGTIAAAPAPLWERVLGAATSAVLVGAGLAAAHPHGTFGGLVLPAELLLAVWVVTGAVRRLRGSAAHEVGVPATA
jgi:hypothetical protein